MAKVNVHQHRTPIFTHEGAPAQHLNPELALRRSVMACMLWEDTFYEDGVEIATRITNLAQHVAPAVLASMAVEARTVMKLRHAPLWLLVALAQRGGNGPLLRTTVPQVIQRADDMAELLALYSRGREDCKKLNKLSKGLKLGIADTFPRFDEYQLAKYNRDGAIKLRDVLFLTHPKPRDEAQAAVWKKLIDGKLEPPDTWEVRLSTGENKRAVFEDLITRRKLGSLALLRNLRGMVEAGIPAELITAALQDMKTERVLPFHFAAAARAVPNLEPVIEAAMLRCLATLPKLPGCTAVVVDNSASMNSPLSRCSKISRRDAASAVAILVREIAPDGLIISFSDYPALVPPRRGFALIGAIRTATHCRMTNTWAAVCAANTVGYNRIIVITDEQSRQAIPAPLPGTNAYFVNVAPYKNGIGYGQWTHIDGWSEAIINYIHASEGTPTEPEPEPEPGGGS